MSERDAYVLRSRDHDEVARLGFQHEVWAEVTNRALDGAGLGVGDAVADVGCGPGFLTMELAARVGPAGSVLGLDSSSHFVERARARAGEAGHANVTVEVADAREARLGPASLDGAVCRWTLMFVDGAERVLERVATALRPGGVFVSMEYFQFRSSALYPRGEAFARTYAAVHGLITRSGGDPDIGARMPGMAARAGLAVENVRAVLRLGRPRDALWRWLEGTHANHPALVDAGLLSRSELDAFLAEWEEAGRTPGAFFSAPPVMVVTARRP